MRKWIILSLVLSILACGHEKKDVKLIPRKDFVDLLVDLHIADAMALNHMINENFGKLDSAILYQSVLDKFGYSRAQMINTMNYYSGNSEKLVEIYDDVFSTLSKRADEAKEFYGSTLLARTEKVWKAEKNRYGIYKDTLNYPPPFDFEIDTLGTFVLSVEIRLSEEDSSINPRINAYFYNSADDRPESRIYFDETPLTKGSFTREYTVLKELKDPEMDHMRITIPQHDVPDTIFPKAIEIRNLRVSLLVPKK